MVVSNNPPWHWPFTKAEMHFENSVDCHSPLIEISREAQTTSDNEFFKPAIMKTTMPLKRFPFSLASMNSLPWNSAHFCKYISSAITTTSEDIASFWSNISTALNETGPPFCNLLVTFYKQLEMCIAGAERIYFSPMNKVGDLWGSEVLFF